MSKCFTLHLVAADYYVFAWFFFFVLFASDEDTTVLRILCLLENNFHWNKHDEVGPGSIGSVIKWLYMECISGFSVWLLSKHPSIQYAATVISIGPSVPAEPSLLSVQLHWVDHSVFFRLKTDYRRIAQKEAYRDLRVFVDHYRESKNKLIVNLVVGEFIGLWDLNGLRWRLSFPKHREGRGLIGSCAFVLFEMSKTQLKRSALCFQSVVTLFSMEIFNQSQDLSLAKCF